MARNYGEGVIRRDMISVLPEDLVADLTANSRWREVPKEKIMAGLMINKLGLMPNGEVFRLEAIVRDISEEEAFSHSIIENYDRDPTTVIDTAHNIRILSEKWNWEDSRICEHYRVKKQDRAKWLSDMRRLVRLPKKRQEEIEDGILNPAIALVLSEIPEAEHEAVLKDAEVIEAERKGYAEVAPEPVVEVEAGRVVDAEWPDIGEAEEAPAQPVTGTVETSPAEDAKPKKKGRGKKKAAAAPKAKKVTKRAVVEAAQRRGLLKNKKVSRTIAQLREYWTPVAEEKPSKRQRLAVAELSLINGGSADEHWAEILAILK